MENLLIEKIDYSKYLRPVFFCNNLEHSHTVSKTGCCDFLSCLDTSNYAPDFDSLHAIPNTKVIQNKSDYQLHPINVGLNIILTCDHASNLLPEGQNWSANDVYFFQQHNAVDIGIWLVTYELYNALQSPTTLARYSRLFIDLNRHISSPTSSTEYCSLVKLDMNSDQNQVKARSHYYDDFKVSLNSLFSSYPNTKLIFSMHSFTPIFEHIQRSVEIGLLYDERFTDTSLVKIIFDVFKSYHYDVRLNEPYRGDLHSSHLDAPPGKSAALQHSIPFLLLEIRQDLAVNVEWRQLFVSRLAELLRSYYQSEMTNLTIT
jgi:predicted N-formylglutamate amidohydrolase